MRSYLLALGLLVAGCGAPRPEAPSDAEPSQERALQTNHSSYEVTRTADALELTVPLTYENPTGQPVYINQCRVPEAPSLQKQVEGEWLTVYSAPRLMCLEPPVMIEAGARYEYTFEMRAGLDPNTFPKLEVEDVPGTYRLVWNLYSHHEPGQAATELLPLAHRISNTFELTE